MEINKVGADFFADNATGLSKEYDFNKDGTVNIEDYRIALIQLNDDDPDNDVKFSKAQLDVIFADVISNAQKTESSSNITEENAQSVASTLIEESKTSIIDPTTAKTFQELQTIGKQLSKCIKQCSELLPILNSQIETKQAELDEIQKEKDEQEKAYANVEEEVNSKSEELASKMAEVASRSESVSAKMAQNSSNVIAQCIQEYKQGEYPNQDLYSVITQKLGENSGESLAVSALRSAIGECGTLGEEIKSLCSDIENIVSDIRSITQKFNDKTTEMNTIKGLRNGVLDTSSRASAEYQKGYQKRLDLRQEIIDKYYVKGNGARDTSNPQLEQITKFLANGELDNLPFADAYAILQGIAGECGIGFSNGNITMPRFVYMKSESEITESEHAAMGIYNNLAAAINSHYASNSTGKVSKAGDADDDDADLDLDNLDDLAGATGDDDDGDVDAEKDDENTEEYLTSGEPTCLGTCTQSTCCDPMTFKNNGQTFHFISDNDNDGVFDGASEFLGAQNGWDEMVAYDTNGDGKVSGDELKNLKLVATNDENGQFTFMSAAEAGINEIDLSSYVDTEEKQVNGDVLQGTFDIKMNDGSVIQAQQTDDAAKNIQMNYANLFGTEIKDMTDEYEDNPFMDEFVETLNTTQTVSQSSYDIAKTDSSANAMIANANEQSEKNITSSSQTAKKEKDASDKQTAKEDKVAQEKQETKKNNKTNKLF
ncbi:MAG: hypothetical protein K6A44_05155 [bacterium]|nr:hypothetical protein [bacterium]